MTAALPFVGRDREVAHLRGALDAALGGRGSVALISGEAGIGKTTLAELACEEARERDALVLTGRCYDLTETAPFAPWLELFSAYPTNSALPEIPDNVARCAIGADVADQAALFAAVLDFLAAVTQVRPVALMLDDQHWADEASLDLLRYVARQAAQLPLLILVTYRGDELASTDHLFQLLPLLAREARALRLNLQPLSSDDLWAIIRPRYLLGAHDEARLTSYLADRTEGNPFFASELLQTLEEEGLLRSEASGWVLGDLGRVRTPVLVEQIVGGRLAQLSEVEQQLLGIAAVLGQEPPLALWGEVAATDPDDLLDLLDRARQARLMTETPDGQGARFIHALVRQAIYERLPPSRRRLLHQQAGVALVSSEAPDPDAVANHFRRSGDARAAEWLIRAGDRAQRAYSWQTAATRFEAAVEAMRAAGEDAEKAGWLLMRVARMRRFASPEEGLAFLEEAARIAETTGDRPLAAAVMRHMGSLNYSNGSIQRGVAQNEQGVAAMARLTPAEHERFFAMEPITGFLPDAHLSRGPLAALLAVAGRFSEAIEHAQPYLAQTTVSERERGNYGDAFSALARAHAMLGKPDESRALYGRATEALGDGRHDIQLAMAISAELEVCVLVYETNNLAERRRLADEAEAAWKRGSGTLADDNPSARHIALQYIEGHWDELRTVALAQRTHGTSAMRNRATYWLGPVARAQGDTELAWELVEECLPGGPATIPGDSIYRTAHSMQRLAAGLALDASDLPTARRWLEAREQWLAWSGAVLGRAATALGWAAYHRAADDLSEARHYADNALRQASKPRQPLLLLAAHRMAGELDIAEGRYDAAAAQLDSALTLAEACAAPYERALTLLALTELELAQDDAGHAAERLAAARLVFESLGAKPALARANALVAQLSPEPSGDRSGTSPTSTAPTPSARDNELLAALTARELDVLRLLPAGHTNREIAELLFLSPKTVEIHVGNVLAKTGVPNRAAAAAFAQRAGLA